MTSILAFAWPFSEAAIERLGWVLVHSLWQLAAAALLAGAAIRVMRRNSAAARYTLLVFAMVLSAGAPVATAILLPDDALGLTAEMRRGPTAEHNAEQPQLAAALPAEASLPTVDLGIEAGAVRPGATHNATAGPRLVLSDAQSEPTWTQRAAGALRPWLAWIVAVWGAGVILCSLRPLLGWRTLRKLRGIGVSPASVELLQALARVSARLGVRRAVRVMQSTLAQVPVVVGYLRPVILVPVGLAANIPASQLEAILAHELAHVLRHDFVVNLVQTLFETVFFYHPAAWWLSRRIRIEREHCCDDLVIARFDNRVDYGRALLAIDELRGRCAVLALGAADGSLLARIRRIAGARAQDSVGDVRERSPAALFSLACLGLALVFSLTWRISAKDTDDEKPPQPTSDERPEPPRLRVKNPDGIPAQFNNVVKANIGFPKSPLPRWVGRPTRDGFVPLDSLPDGTHWLLAAGDGEARTAFPVKLPSDPPLIERRLRAGRAWTAENIDLKVTAQDDGETGAEIVIEIDNHGKAALQASEEDVQIQTEVRGELIRGVSPLWLTVHRKPFPRVTIEPGQTGRLPLNWTNWVRMGLWSSRSYEDIDEPALPAVVPGKLWVRVGLGNNCALPVSVTHPTDILEKNGKESAAAFPPPSPEKLRGFDLSKTAVRRMAEAQDKTPDLYIPDKDTPGFWTQPKNVFEMPLAEHIWLKYPTRSGHFYIEHRPDGTWQSEVLYGPIAGDPFELLKLDDLLREQLKSSPFGGDATYRLRLMFRTGDPGLVRRAWELIEPLMGGQLPGRDEGLFGRIGLLNVVREALRDDAAALEAPALRVVVARMRKTVSKTEAAIDALNDSLPDSSYQSVTYSQEKLVLKIPEALWGKPLDGLRLALVPREWALDRDWNELPRDARLPVSVAVGPGSTLEYQLVVENVSDQDIKLSGYLNGEEIGRRLEVFDKNGKRVEIRSVHTSILRFQTYWRLKPGERQLLSLPEVHFTPAGPQQSLDGLGYFVKAVPGEYTLRCSVFFGDLDNTRHRHVPGKSEWIGQLTTGTQKITVGGTGAAEPPDSTPSTDRENNDEKPAEKQERTDKTEPAKGLEFLAPYPKLRGLSLEMTEKEFLALAEKETLRPRKTSGDDGTQYRVATGDGHTVIVMFRKGAEKCTGIQRLRGEDPTPAFILPDHLNVMAVGFDRDGKNLVSVATEKDVSIRTWDVGEHKLEHEARLDTDKHGNFFLGGHLTLSADRTRVLALIDGKVGIWETATGKLVKMLTLPNELQRGMVQALDCTPDLSLVACGWISRGIGSEARAVVWDVQTDEVLQTVTHVDGVQLHCVALSPDGKWLATGSQQAGACVWDVGSGERLYALPNDNPGREHPDPVVSQVAANQVLCLRFSPDSRRLAMGDMLGVKLVEARSGEFLHQFDAPFRFGRSGLVFSRDGRMLARVATDKVVPIWSTQTGKQLAELPTEAHDGSFSPDGQWFAVGFTDQHNGVAVWRLQKLGIQIPAASRASKQDAANLANVLKSDLPRYELDLRVGGLASRIRLSAAELRLAGGRELRVALAGGADARPGQKQSEREDRLAAGMKKLEQKLDSAAARREEALQRAHDRLLRATKKAGPEAGRGDKERDGERQT